mgnify:CR=1 FL=1
MRTPSFRQRGLEREANKILAEDRAQGGTHHKEINLKSANDSRRLEVSRGNSNQANQVLLETRSAPAEYRHPPEKLLERRQQYHKIRTALSNILVKFDNDYAVKAILLLVLHTKLGIRFNESQRLAEVAGISIPAVNAAKKRLKRYVREKYPDLLD